MPILSARRHGNNIGLLHEYRHEHAAATEAYRHALAVSPDHTDAQRALGRTYARRGNVERALGLLASASGDGGPGRTRYLLGKVSLLHGDLGHARAIADGLRASDVPADAALGLSLAGQIVRLVDNDFAEAARLWSEALRYDRSDAETRYYVAVATWRDGNSERAEWLLRQSLAAQPDSLRAVNMLGMVAYNAKDWDAADGWYADARALSPYSPILPYNLGEVASRSGRPDAAVAFYQESVELSDGFTMGHVSLAEALEATGAWELAAAHYAKALEYDPGNDGTLKKLATLWETHGQPQRARQVRVAYRGPSTSAQAPISDRQ